MESTYRMDLKDIMVNEKISQNVAFYMILFTYYSKNDKIIEMENISVAARGYVLEVFVSLNKWQWEFYYDNGTVLCVNHDCSYINLYMIVFHRTTHTHTHTHTYTHRDLNKVCSLLHNIVPVSISWFW